MVKLKSPTVYDIIILVSLLMACLNTITIISEKLPTIQIAADVGVFIVIAIMSFVAKKTNRYLWPAVVFAIAGIAATYGASTEGNISGIIFILFAIYIFNKRLSTVILLSLTGLVLVVKTMIHEYTISQSFGTAVAYFFVLAIYYILIHPKKPHMISNPKIDEITEEIIILTISGYRPKVIGDRIKLSADAVCKRLSKACKDFECGTSEQLIYKLTEMGYIKRN